MYTFLLTFKVVLLLYSQPILTIRTWLALTCHKVLLLQCSYVNVTSNFHFRWQLSKPQLLNLPRKATFCILLQILLLQQANPTQEWISVARTDKFTTNWHFQMNSHFLCVTLQSSLYNCIKRRKLVLCNFQVYVHTYKIRLFIMLVLHYCFI